MGNDYNIYIRTIGSNGQGNSPTTPWQVASGNGDEVVESGGEFNPSGGIKKAAAFLQNPDSLIGSVLRTPIGKLGVAAAIFIAAAHIVDRALTLYQSFAAPASGDYKFQIDYANFKQDIHNVLHPVSTFIQAEQMKLHIKKENLANEQERLLLGGTYLNAPYGRYL